MYLCYANSAAVIHFSPFSGLKLQLISNLKFEEPNASSTKWDKIFWEKTCIVIVSTNMVHFEIAMDYTFYAPGSNR